MNEKRRYLELDIKDFGPIAKAEVELRPLTAFVGPSNTGKSYLAILIYALHRFFYRHGRHARGPLFLHSANKKIIDRSIGPLIDLFQSLEYDKNKSRTETLLSPSLIQLLQSYGRK